MATKRKAPEGSAANGKRKAVETPEADNDDGLLDVLGDNGLLEGENDDAALQDALAGDGLGDELVDNLDGEFGDQEGDGFGDEGEGDGESTGEDELEDEDRYESEAAASEPEENDEDVELPVPEATLTTAEKVEISGPITAAQARRVASLLYSNSELKTIVYDSHELTTEDLRENDELEWDGEDYTDVEAIIIAAFLKDNKELTRLDLARNSIADAGAIALAAALRENTKLEYLNLESNVVAEKGGKAMCEAVAVNSTLTYLNVKDAAFSITVQQELRDLWMKGRNGSNLGLHL